MPAASRYRNVVGITRWRLRIPRSASFGRVAGTFAVVAVSWSLAAGHAELQVVIDELDRRIAADQGNAELYLRRGEMHRLHRDWPAALADYERAAGLDPSLHEVDLFRGRMHLDADHPREALAALDRFLAARPGDVRALVHRAEAKVRLGDGSGGARDYTAAIEGLMREGRSPTPEMFIERSRALAAAGPEHRKAALRGLEQGMDLLGRPITLELEALELELALGRTEAALARVERLAETTAAPEPWILRKAEILERSGRTDEARVAYRRVLEGLEARPAHRRRAGPLAELEARARESLARLNPQEGPLHD